MNAKGAKGAKRGVGQINVLIHALGGLLLMPQIIEPGEKIEFLSLGTGNSGRPFDLEIDRRVAEFKLIHLTGGTEPIRNNDLFKDFTFSQSIRPTSLCPFVGLLFGMTPTLTATTIQSPVGELTLASITDPDGSRVCLVEFGHRAPRAMDALATMFDAAVRPGVDPPECPALARLVGELGAYFTGDLRVFTVPLELAGTAFQTGVWRGLLDIPYGRTVGYGQLAARLGKDAGAARAVGAANGANRLAIVVPCHRVVAADGSLHGYGGGLDRKRWLLEHERTVAGGLFATAG